MYPAGPLLRSKHLAQPVELNSWLDARWFCMKPHGILAGSRTRWIQNFRSFGFVELLSVRSKKRGRLKKSEL